MIIEGAEPFLMRGGSTGILLIHGFTGLPAELLLLGEYLNRAGFTVLGVRLAGHGTSELDLARTTREDWLNSALDGCEILSGLCEKIYVVGHSMGALLALKLSALKKVDRLILISAPIFVDEGLGAKNLPPREKCAGLYVSKARRNLPDVPPAVNRTYHKMPLVSVHELFELIAEVKKILPQIETPLLIMHGTDDHTAKISSAKFIAETAASSVVELVTVQSGGHLLPLTESREFVFEAVLKFCLRG